MTTTTTPDLTKAKLSFLGDIDKIANLMLVIPNASPVERSARLTSIERALKQLAHEVSALNTQLND